MSKFSALAPLVKSLPKTLGTILGDLVEVGGQKRFATLRDDIWFKVDDAHVVDQIGKLAEKLRPHGWSVEIVGETVRLGPLMAAPIAEISSPSDAASDIGWIMEAHARGEAKLVELAAEIDRVTAQRDAERERANRLEAQLGTMDSEDADRIAGLEAEVEHLQTALDAERVRTGAFNGSVNTETRDAPLALAPWHVTIPVSESLYRWLEGVALRNRCSPEHVASRLMIAFRAAAVDQAKGAA